MRIVWASSLFCGLFSCIPTHLQKYQEKKPNSSPLGENHGLSDPISLSKEKEVSQETTSRKSSDEKIKPIGTGSSLNTGDAFFQTDQNTFFIRFQEPDVWEAILDILIKNYSLAIVDRNAGVLATDWDSFYIGKRVFRNKLSFRIKKTSLKGDRPFGVEFIIHNNVEKLGESPQQSIGIGSVWLPAQDPIDEVTRIVQNMALLLRLPPPQKLYNAKDFLNKKASPSHEER